MKKIFKIIMFVFIGIIGIGVIGALLGDDDNADTNNSEPATAEASEEATEDGTEEDGTEDDASEDEATEEETEAEETEQTVKIGEPLDVNDIIFTVNGYSTSDTVGDQYLNETANGEFLLFEVSIENTRSEALTMNSDFFKLIAGGSTYESDSMYSVYLGDDSIIYESINPGLTLNGVIPFDVPPGLDLSDAVIQAQTGIFGTEKGEIDISE
ncbi:DUF4352 domain-containing protein [Shouchella lehensis]|uniref:DUF4352 domain-containing protein n=1 Tax=Shouchella lehensis G1 TaxID=1246626 RepID=A0A060LZ06_9BACI|nr:DUF4352 domain-containing protein [Shouchella lehensis]AIC95427.1 hypothetical protein BleG1_2863 [Shouchella lehensis G1]